MVKKKISKVATLRVRLERLCFPHFLTFPLLTFRRGAGARKCIVKKCSPILMSKALHEFGAEHFIFLPPFSYQIVFSCMHGEPGCRDSRSLA